MSIKQKFQYSDQTGNRAAYTIEELEKLLNFKYLHKITFTTFEERQDIQAKGFNEWKNKKVRLEAEELGHKYLKEIEAGTLSDISIRWIDADCGHGLFVEEDLEAGAYVGEYTGVIRNHYRRQLLEPINNYCYQYPLPDTLEGGVVIDATDGNFTRFINHSRKPNLQQAYAFHNGFYHLIFLAAHPIKKGTQLSYNYGSAFWSIRAACEKFEL
jgi:SET domain-containing protein